MYPMVANSVIGVVFISVIANLFISIGVMINPVVRKLHLLYARTKFRRQARLKRAKAKKKKVSF